MTYLYLASFVIGLLFAVRLMFFGAERRRLPSPQVLPLRRSEPAAVAFVAMFGTAGYLLGRNSGRSPGITALMAATLALVFAAVVTRVAIAAARIKPEHDPDDPRYVHQGVVGVVTVTIPAAGEGRIRFDGTGVAEELRARNILGGAIPAGDEVCIERIEDGVAHVELWSLVESRL
ncbi:MAG: hypothetical protein JWM95_3712 [Gemmatimonadetes bacterium]|nr:hypothetical protein [Gemmatimonadota bacterium]